MLHLSISVVACKPYMYTYWENCMVKVQIVTKSGCCLRRRWEAAAPFCCSSVRYGHPFFFRCRTTLRCVCGALVSLICSRRTRITPAMLVKRTRPYLLAFKSCINLRCIQNPPVDLMLQRPKGENKFPYFCGIMEDLSVNRNLGRLSFN